MKNLRKEKDTSAYQPDYHSTREEFVRVECRLKSKKKSNTTQHSPELRVSAQQKEVSSKILGGYIRQAKFLLSNKRHSSLAVSEVPDQNYVQSAKISAKKERQKLAFSRRSYMSSRDATTEEKSAAAGSNNSACNASRRSYMSSRDRQSANYSEDPLKAGASVSAASTTTGRVPYKSLTKSPSANTMDVLDTHSTQSAENIGGVELESQKPPAFAFAVVTAGRGLGAVSPSIAALSAAHRRATRNCPERRVGKCLLQKVHAKQGNE